MEQREEFTQTDVATLCTGDDTFVSISDLIRVLKVHEKKSLDIKVEALCDVLLQLMNTAEDNWDH